MKVHVDGTMGKAKLIDEIFGEHVEPKLIQPTFITDYPVEMSPLAKNINQNQDLLNDLRRFVMPKKSVILFQNSTIQLIREKDLKASWSLEKR